jgi:hypothetical protein
MSEKLDEIKGWRAYAELRETETNPRRRKMLANMMDHYKWECLGEPDKLLEGVHPEAHYRFYGGPEVLHIRGHDEIRAFYQGMADSGANRLQLDVDNMLVDDEVVSAHGTWHQVQYGHTLQGDGLATSDVVDDPDARYLTSQRMAWFMPYSDDEEPLLTAEIVFFHPAPLEVRKLAEGEEVFGKLTEDMFRL